MKTRFAMALGLIAIAAVATLGIYLSRQEEEEQYATDVPWTGEVDDDNPFAEMIEEGAGLIAMLRAQAAEQASKMKVA